MGHCPEVGPYEGPILAAAPCESAALAPFEGQTTTAQTGTRTSVHMHIQTHRSHPVNTTTHTSVLLKDQRKGPRVQCPFVSVCPYHGGECLLVLGLAHAVVSQLVERRAIALIQAESTRAVTTLHRTSTRETTPNSMTPHQHFSQGPRQRASVPVCCRISQRQLCRHSPLTARHMRISHSHSNVASRNGLARPTRPAAHQHRWRPGHDITTLIAA